MRDDGAGIDVDAVKQRALEKGLISDEYDGDSRAVMQILFHPGFSTKEIITDISGRGVGLDVVMSNIQAINGAVAVSSEIGQGTEFELVLPLTVMTISALWLI